jgi:hypothetical protein
MFAGDGSAATGGRATPAPVAAAFTRAPVLPRQFSDRAGTRGYGLSCGPDSSAAMAEIACGVRP